MVRAEEERAIRVERKDFRFAAPDRETAGEEVALAHKEKNLRRDEGDGTSAEGVSMR